MCKSLLTLSLWKQILTKVNEFNDSFYCSYYKKNFVAISQTYNQFIDDNVKTYAKP